MKSIAADSSALVAIMNGEIESAIFVGILLAADRIVLSAANLLETRMVLHGRNPNLPDRLGQFLQEMGIQIEPVTKQQSDIAFEAFKRFGKGSGHKAGLNFGDCLAYALAKERGIPLLFKGDDFSHTDIAPA